MTQYNTVLATMFVPPTWPLNWPQMLALPICHSGNILSLQSTTHSPSLNVSPRPEVQSPDNLLQRTSSFSKGPRFPEDKCLLVLLLLVVYHSFIPDTASC